MNVNYLANILRKHISEKWNEKIENIEKTNNDNTQHTLSSSFHFTTKKGLFFSVNIETSKSNEYHKSVLISVRVYETESKKELRFIQKNYEYNSYNESHRFYQIANEIKEIF